MVLSRLTKITSPGIKTDTNWVGNNANFTGVTTAGSSFNVGISTFHSTLAEVHNIKSTGIITATGGSFSGNVTAVDGTFTGNVSIAGTLTYEDVTNIDSVGIITAPAVDVDDFLDVGSNIKLGNAGVITATSFVGSGAALTGIDATAIKDTSGNVKVQAQASGAVYTGIHTFNSDLDVDGHTNLDNVSIAGVATIHQLKMGDNKYLQLGNGPDLQLYHDGSNSYVNDIGTGSLFVSGSAVRVQSDDNRLNDANGNVIIKTDATTAYLYYEGSNRLNTTSVGINIPQDLDVDGHTNLDNVSVAGVSTFSDNIILPDDKKIQLGDNQDLEILHDPSNGIIRSINSGGNMHVESKNHIELNVNYNTSNGSKENALKAIANAGVSLYFNSVSKFSTTNTGINVTGNVVSDGLVVDGNSDLNGDLDVDGHTNLDNVSIAGVTTFSDTIRVGTGVTIETNGQGTFSGIVTATAFKLSDGSNVGGTDSDAQNNTIGGTNAGDSFSGTNAQNNTLFGYNAGTAITTADRNTFFGSFCGHTVTGNNNTFFGYQIGDSTITGSSNIAIGTVDLLKRLTSGSRNIVIGAESGTKLTTTGDNILIGYEAGQEAGIEYSIFLGPQSGKEVTGSANIGLGLAALQDTTSGTNNIAVGLYAGQSLASGEFNISLGGQAIQYGQNRDFNIGIGQRALRVTTADHNIAIGYQSCWSNNSISGGSNVFLGSNNAQNNLSSGSNNLCLGYNVGQSITTGSNNIVLGSEAEPSSATVSNEITLGDANITKFRVPGINVTLKDNGGTPTQGHVLTVDGSGEAGFAAVSADLVNDTSPQLGGLLDGNGQTANFTGNTTGLGLPIGTTGQEPTPSNYKGYIRFNDTDDTVYYCDGTSWNKINAVLCVLNSVGGSLFAGAASNITLSGTGFLASGLVVNFVQSSDGINSNVTVTPSSDIAATVAVPAAVYNNVSAGNAVTIKVTNSDGQISGTVNKTATSLPTGGNSITTSGSYRIHTFTSSGTWVNTIASLSVEYLVIAGGGGGGSNSDVGGGGGAGGYLEGTTTANAQSYGVTVGNGGAGGCGGQGGGGGCDGSQGGNSSALGVTSIGGGGGGTRYNGGGSGGSGGGGGDGGASGGSGTSGQGHNGGNAPGMDTNNMNDQGAGGGAGSAASSWNPGSGKASSITGSSVTYAKGGVGLNHAQWAQAAANTGNGGRGAYHQSQNTGGSGIVVIRYQL